MIYAALAYLVVILLIGLASTARTRSAGDFFIAGRRVGLWVMALATMSAAFSGFVFLGGPGLTYRIGLASLMIVLPLSLTGGLLCWVVALRLRRLSEAREVYTLAEALGVRFPGRGTAALAALAILLGTIAYLGLQMQVLGVLFESVFDLSDPRLAMGLGVAVLVAYGVMGGMVAGVYTDLVQGALMLVAATVVFGRAVAIAGGWREMLARIAASPEFGVGFLEPLGRVPAFTAFGFFFVFGVGVLGQPHMLHKFYMIDDPRKLRWMPLLLGASQTVCVLIWIGIGLAVPALVAAGRMAAPVHPDRVAPAFLLEFLPDALAGLVFAGILSAVMSTADSLLNIGSAALTRDLPRALGRAPRDDLRDGRLAVVAVALGAALIAWSYGDLIALLGTFAFGMFAAALAPAVAIGLNWDRVTSRAAAASIATGLVLQLGLELWARHSGTGRWPRLPLADGVLPSAVALAASFTVLLTMSLLGPAQPPDADVQAILRGERP